MAVTAAVRTWPFRVYSFPSAIDRRAVQTIYPVYGPDGGLGNGFLAWDGERKAWIVSPEQSDAYESMRVSVYDNRLLYHGSMNKLPRVGDSIHIAEPSDPLTWKNLKRSPTSWPPLAIPASITDAQHALKASAIPNDKEER